MKVKHCWTIIWFDGVMRSLILYADWPDDIPVGMLFLTERDAQQICKWRRERFGEQCKVVTLAELADPRAEESLEAAWRKISKSRTREAFEAWANNNGYSIFRLDGIYVSDVTETVWQAFVAGAGYEAERTRVAQREEV